ncbi:hypothetical protein F4821DRAFT_245645 [Hypoxylon rubiginosum]|uniref:Uncharacterized protein n=1 Tax=Hypoxylon rubiginosum TaxID=110542 RepID=A0ACC0CS33_9PEZI|nr:hypothetical protein F4821DRAFT_245645 [Hypoxylon rubiginosum]
MLSPVINSMGGLVGAVLLANAVATQLTQSITDVWQLGPAPASLDATVVGARSTIIEHVSFSIVSYAVDCPAASSPENDACRDLHIYPALLYHTQDSIYGGYWVEHDSYISSTTAWRCELGDCGPWCTASVQTADCVMTIGGYIETTTTRLESCRVAQNFLPLAIVDGIQILDADRTRETYNISQYISSKNDYLSKIGCGPKSTLGTTVWSAPYRISPSNVGITITATAPTSISTTTPATGPFASQDLATATSQSTSPTPTSGADRWSQGGVACEFIALCLTLAFCVL